MGVEMRQDIIKFLEELDQQRYRAVIIHASPEKSQVLSKFIIRVANKAKGKYIDLLDKFIQSKELHENIEVFRPEVFRDFIIEQSRAQSLLVIDRVDFLLDTWRKKERDVFFQMILEQWDGYKEASKAKLIVCLQTSFELENLQSTQSENKKIFQLEEFSDIGSGR